MTLTAVVVGCGAMGAQFDAGRQDDYVLSHANACRRHHGTELVAGVDVDADKRSAFTTAWDRPAYGSISESAQDHDVDLACISTPAETHESVVMEATDSGVRGILCEKPLAPEEASAGRIVDRCDSEDVRLAVNYIRRFTPGVRDVRDFIADGKLGTIDRALFTYSKDLLENGSHMVDLARWWFGDVEAITRVGEGVPVDAVLQCERADCRIVGIGTTAYSMTRADIYGDAGAIRLTDNGNVAIYADVTDDPVYPGFDRLSERSRETTGIYRATLFAVDDLLTAIRTGDPVACPGADALETLQVCEAMGADPT